MKPQQIVSTYEKTLDLKVDEEAIIKDCIYSIESEKKTIDRLLKSIKFKTDMQSKAATSLKSCDIYLEINKSRYMDCKVSVTALDKLLKEHEKIQNKINLIHAAKKLFGA